MTESGLVYEPWQSLDCNKQYCLVDTMILLQIYRRNPRLFSMANAVCDKRTLLLVPDVVGECAKVFDENKPDVSVPEYMYVGNKSGDICGYSDGPVTKEDLRIDPKSRSEFDRILIRTLRGRKMEFAACLPNQDTYTVAENMQAQKIYENKKRKPLSSTDCLILRLAMENPNVTVLTDDMMLTKAVLDKCGPGRTSYVFCDYFGRLNMAARFFSRVLGVGFVHCNPIRDVIEYGVVDIPQNKTSFSCTYLSVQDNIPRKDISVLATIDLGYKDISATYNTGIRNIRCNDMKDAVCALVKFIQIVIQDWYCACGDPDWTTFNKEWTKMEYGTDTAQTNANHMSYCYKARSVLKQNCNRYCACACPDRRLLHDLFRDIMSNKI